MSSAIPGHGTRSRFAEPWGCRCVSCTTRKPIDPGTKVRWPLQYLASSIRLSHWDLPEDLVQEWADHGLSDAEADEIAIMIGSMPNEIWPGYTQAGLDFPGAFDYHV
jgi:hypothetical protein